MHVNQYPVIVVAIGQTGCPGCAEFLPVFRACAERYGTCVPSVFFDVQQHDGVAEFARAHGVEFTPSFFVLRYGRRSSRIMGNQPVEVVEAMFQNAARGLECSL